MSAETTQLEPVPPPSVSPPCPTCGKRPLIFERIAAVIGDVKAVGKNGRNKEHNYDFRSIDDFYDALSPALAKHQVCITPTILSSQRITEGKTGKGAPIVRLVIRYRYRIWTIDGSFVEADVDAEAVEYGGDKVPYKAASGAYKYLVQQVFAVRVHEEKTPEPEDEAREDRANEPPSKWKGKATPPAQAAPADEAKKFERFEELLRKKLAAVKTIAAMDAWIEEWKAAPPTVKRALHEEGKKRRAELEESAARAEAAAAAKAAEGPQVPRGGKGART